VGKNIQFSKDELTTMINKGINPNPLSTPDFTKNGSILQKVSQKFGRLPHATDCGHGAEIGEKRWL